MTPKYFESEIVVNVEHLVIDQIMTANGFHFNLDSNSYRARSKVLGFMQEQTQATIRDLKALGATSVRFKISAVLQEGI